MIDWRHNVEDAQGLVALSQLDATQTKSCAFCKQTFCRDKRNTKAYWEKARFCSRKCASLYGAKSGRLSVEEKKDKLRRLSEADVDTGCWNWKGATNGRYGLTSLDGKRIYAHRASLTLKLGREIGDGLFCCHKCDNPLCVNPDHLYEGTQKRHMADAVSRGKVWWRKLTESDVRAIRSSAKTTAQLARDFGVSEPSIQKVRDRKTWRHV